jgi:hypothetical protein
MTIKIKRSIENKRNTNILQSFQQGPISFRSIKWENKGMKGFRYHTTLLQAHISYDRVEDFINGKTMEDSLSMVWKKRDTILGVKIKKG